MFRNYLVVAFRSILKRRAYSAINIFGLSTGISAVVLIVLFLQDELSYDKFHENSEDIYRIAWFSADPQTRTPHPMAQAMVQDFPSVVAATSLSPLWGPGLTRQVFAMKNPETDVWYEEAGILGVDSTFFDVFSFSLVVGNPSEVMRNVGGVLISESMATKYFGQEDPVGKFLAINDDETLLMVEGVLKDVPENSHFHFDFLVSYVTLKAFGPPDNPYYTWADFGHFNYVRLSPGSSSKELEDQLIRWMAQYVDWDEETIETINTTGFQFRLQPIEDIHLRSSIRWELEPTGNMGYVYIMSAAAFFILLIACFNFMTLSTARSMERSGEVGVRKAVGAHRGQLLGQFVGESILISLIAVFVAGLLVEIVLPSFNAVSGKEMSLEISNPLVILGFLVTAVVIGIVAGIYPAMFLSSIKPASILKGKHSGSQKGQFIRKMLVTVQFALSMFLVAGAWTVIQQINFIQNKELGFDKEQILVMPIRSEQTRSQFELLQTELKRIAGVKSVSAASNIPGKQFNQNPMFTTEDDQNVIMVKQCFVDYEIFDALGIEVQSGRTFSRDRPADVRNAFVLNEAAATALSLSEPVGKAVTLDADGDMIEGEVIGVMKDFNYQSLHQPIRPLVFQLLPAYNHIVVKLETSDFETTLSEIQAGFLEVEQRFPFQYEFFDQTLGNQYKKEERMAAVFTGFSILAIVIACLGLAGLAAINFAFRKKEVGIKKILGAAPTSLATNLLREYTMIVLIAVVVAAPFYWMIISQWLDNFNYRVDLNPVNFLLTGSLLIVMAWITLSYLTLNTIRTNPADVLREE